MSRVEVIRLVAAHHTFHGLDKVGFITKIYEIVNQFLGHGDFDHQDGHSPSNHQGP